MTIAERLATLAEHKPLEPLDAGVLGELSRRPAGGGR